MPKLKSKTSDPTIDPTVDPGEVARFAAMAEEWWDDQGRFAPLHRFNPVRLTYIRDAICARFKRDPHAARPLTGLSLLDIGCGGGLVCEPLARLGAEVVGIDAGEESVAAARHHAAGQGLRIDYRVAAAGDLVKEKKRFDAVLSLEVIEHAADPRAFVDDCAALVKPEGILIVATLNRTIKSFLFGVVGAEYVLRWLPVGTHDWRRFVRPSELARHLRGAGMKITDLAGVTYNPISDRFSLNRGDVDVNYLASAVRE